MTRQLHENRRELRYRQGMKRFFVILLLALSVSATGCYRYSITARDVPSDGEKHLGRGVLFFWGMVGTRRYAKCEGRALAKVSTFQPWWSFFVSAITFGIVTPWRSTYQCAAPGR